MNIVKLQSQLQKVPDQALIGYVQNPDGQVPSYLALAELTRRKEMRSSAAPQQPMPTQTVAAQEVAEAGPGIAALPVPDQMFNPESYASGGIVAFDEGGEVKNYAPGGFVPSPMGDAVLPLMGSSGDLLARIEELKRSNPWMSEQQLKAQIAAEATVPQIPAVQQKMIEGRPAPTPLNYDRPTPQQIMSQVAQRDRVAAAPTAPVVSGIGRVEYVAPTDYSDEYDQNIRPEISAQDAMAKFQGLMGTDVGRQKMQKQLDSMESKAAKDEERAPWMALAEAGLGMAGGRSQFAIQNIAEGGTKGLKSYADARDRLNKAEERRFELSSKIAQAERAEQVAAATYGLQSEEAVKARNEANRLAKLGYKANLASDKAKGEFEAKKTNLEADIAEKKLQEEARWHDRQYDADMARTKVMGANAQFTKEQAQATNLLKQIMAPKIAALKAAGMAEEEAYDQVFPSALTQLPPNMLAALGYNADTLPKPTATGPRKKPLSAF